MVDRPGARGGEDGTRSDGRVRACVGRARTCRALAHEDVGDARVAPAGRDVSDREPHSDVARADGVLRDQDDVVVGVGHREDLVDAVGQGAGCGVEVDELTDAHPVRGEGDRRLSVDRDVARRASPGQHHGEGVGAGHRLDRVEAVRSGPCGEVEVDLLPDGPAVRGEGDGDDVVVPGVGTGLRDSGVRRRLRDGLAELHLAGPETLDELLADVSAAFGRPEVVDEPAVRGRGSQLGPVLVDTAPRTGLDPHTRAVGVGAAAVRRNLEHLTDGSRGVIEVEPVAAHDVPGALARHGDDGGLILDHLDPPGHVGARRGRSDVGQSACRVRASCDLAELDEAVRGHRSTDGRRGGREGGPDAQEVPGDAALDDALPDRGYGARAAVVRQPPDVAPVDEHTAAEGRRHGGRAQRSGHGRGRLRVPPGVCADRELPAVEGPRLTSRARGRGVQVLVSRDRRHRASPRPRRLDVLTYCVNGRLASGVQLRRHAGHLRC